MLELVHVVKVLGAILCLSGIVLCWKISSTNFSKKSTTEEKFFVHVKLSPAAFWKLLAFVAIVVVPGLAMTVANYHTFIGVHEVRACARCHVMLPMVNDLRDPESNTLAARHFKNRWIAENQCFACHSDYGLSGDLESKMEGFRHLARYTSRTYKEPIKMRGHFNNNNCLKCHEKMPKFEAVKSHNTVRTLLEDSSMACLNCHGKAHPSRGQRTPGSADYPRLMEEKVAVEVEK